MQANEQPLVRRWTRHPASVGRARSELKKALANWCLNAVEDAALVVLSELVTNAVRHARVSPGREIERGIYVTYQVLVNPIRIFYRWETFPAVYTRSMLRVFNAYDEFATFGIGERRRNLLNVPAIPRGALEVPEVRLLPFNEVESFLVRDVSLFHSTSPGRGGPIH